MVELGRLWAYFEGLRRVSIRVEGDTKRRAMDKLRWKTRVGYGVDPPNMIVHGAIRTNLLNGNFLGGRHSFRRQMRRIYGRKE